MAMTTEKHNPLEPEFRLEETDRRTKIGRVMMVIVIVAAVAFAWMTSAG